VFNFNHILIPFFLMKKELIEISSEITVRRIPFFEWEYNYFERKLRLDKIELIVREGWDIL